MFKLLCLLFLTGLNIFAQQKDNFKVKITEVRGDLNKDNIDDLVTVSQDTLNDKAPYKIQVFFAQPDGSLKLQVASEQLIEPQYLNGKDGYRTGNGFAGIEIKKGVLIVNNDLLRGHYEYKFRYQNGNFELIGFSETSSDGQGVISSVDFNLSTGMRITKSERYDYDKVISNEKKKVMIRPLPKLQDIVPFEGNWY